MLFAPDQNDLLPEEDNEASCHRHGADMQQRRKIDNFVQSSRVLDASVKPRVFCEARKRVSSLQGLENRMNSNITLCGTI